MVSVPLLSLADRGVGFDGPLAIATIAGRKHALADQIAGLYYLRDRAGRRGAVGHFVHRLMEIRIELLAERRELLDAVLLQHFLQFALGEIDALDQRFDLGIRARRAARAPIARARDACCRRPAARRGQMR